MWVPSQLPSYQWGFLFENVHFTPFDGNNNELIELEFRSRGEHFSHSIDIIDSHLKYPAKIYFGVAQTHLRMPGTRYYVKRKEVRPQENKVQQQQLQTIDRLPPENQVYYAVPMGLWPNDELPIGVLLQPETLAAPWRLIGQLHPISTNLNTLLEHYSLQNS
jgi:hypothetical protein